LGAVIYEMLTGDPPHTGSSSQAVIARLLTERPRAIRATRPNVAAHVEAAVERALEKLPADRFASAREFAEALTGARPVAAAERAPTSAVIALPTERRFIWLLPWAIALAASAVAIATTIRPKPAPPVAVRLQVEIPDTVQVRLGYGLALSRDGTQLVFSGTAASPNPSPAAGAAPRTLYLRRLADEISLPVRGAEDARNPAFSPDGQTLLFVAGTQAQVEGGEGGMTLRTVPVSGGISKEIARDVGASAAWGENGEVFFTSARGLEAVSSNGGDRRLVSPASATRFFVAVEILPGGHYAIVTFATSGFIGLQYNRLAIVSLADGTFSDLGMQGSGARYDASGYIIFGRGAGETFAAPFSLRTRQVTGAAVPLVQGVRGGALFASGLAVSQNGMLAYIAAGPIESRSEMVIVDARGSARPMQAEPGVYAYPRISPDGRHAAVSVRGSAATGVGGAVYVYDVATGVGARVSTDSNSWRPEWSRDGSRILFPQTLSDATLLWSRPWDLSSLPTMIARGGAQTFYEVAPGNPGGVSVIRNGTAGTTNAIATSIMLAPTESLGVQRPLFDRSAVITGLRLSPNGRLLAYSSTESQRLEVYVTPVPGPGPRVQVSLHGGAEPAWSHDGRVLYYRSSASMRGKAIMAATVVEQPALAVARRDSLFADVYAAQGTHGNFDVFPDGRFLMLRPLATPTSQRERLFVVTNWPQLIESSKRNP
jgi:serine/threonine-protein kinase